MNIGNKFNTSFHTKSASPAEELEQAVKTSTGVDCTIRVEPLFISVRTKDYMDYVLARSFLRHRTGKMIERDLGIPGAAI